MTAAELRKQLAEAEEQERKEREELRKTVKPRWEYHVSVKPDPWHKVFSDEHIIVRLWQKLLNREEILAVGGSDHYDGSGMSYIYHPGTRKIVTGVGGGLVMISDQETADRLGEFLAKNPDGGVCTECFRQK